MSRLASLLLLLPLATACVSTGDRRMEITPPSTLSTMIGGELALDLPSGDIRIGPSDDEQLHVSVRFFCNADSDTCRGNAGRARIVHEQQGNLSTISFRPGSAYSARHANLIFEIAVPDLEALTVGADAGAIAIDSPTGCLSARAKAGDLSITAPMADVGAVDLKAFAGDASLRTAEGMADDERPLLVGGKVQWEDGAGDCRLTARLTAGEISVELR